MTTGAEVAQERLTRKLTSELGATVVQALEDPDVIEVILNPDGSLWKDTLSSGMTEIGEMNDGQARNLLNTIAHMLGIVVTKESPIVEGELPLDGSRFEGLFPPVVPSPTFTIRKKASLVFTLDDYVEQGGLTTEQRDLLISAVKGKKNILVVGGTGSGKTTLSNAVLRAISEHTPADRIVIMEDTLELQCSCKNKVMLRASQYTTMRQLLRATMRLRPDRVVVGEVRGPEALDLLKAWSTGHPGGLCTVHANSALEGLYRLESLVQEANVPPDPGLIGRAVDLSIFIQKTPTGRKVTEVVEVEGFADGVYITKNR